LFAGKPAVFEAPAVHRDSIAMLPRGAEILARNDFGVQAAAFTFGRSTFWGVQYHPEYDYLDLAATAERYGDTLVNEGMFRDRPALDDFAAELRALQKKPLDTALLWKHGLGPSVQSDALRLLEIRNWLSAQVLPRSRRRD
jgi:GMP synthase (glutamine-hydrolysing)